MGSGAGHIHRAAAVGFARAGADYEQGRPGYPPAAMARLAAELGLGPGRVVLDLAAGTGKLTRAVASTGAELVAVEPVADMRAQLQLSLPQASVLPGTAESIPLPAASVDAVVVGQAFHWFDAPAAAREIHRVLRPGGALAVTWNAWNESVRWVKRVQALVHEHVHGAPQQRTSRWPQELARTGLFSELGRETFGNPVHGDLDRLKAQVASVSYISALDPAGRGRVLEAVTQIVTEDPQTRGRATFDMPYMTTLTWWRRC
ncbi:MAG: class I SAM-dependent methyltransferase [Actinomycetota bacterium]|nr:class I SAM-dependent methyltransferase [Actinomycetota bacterium]